MVIYTSEKQHHPFEERTCEFAPPRLPLRPAAARRQRADMGCLSVGSQGTVYEVKIVGEEPVYRVNHRRMMEWANREAANVSRRT